MFLMELAKFVYLSDSWVSSCHAGRARNTLYVIQAVSSSHAGRARSMLYVIQAVSSCHAGEARSTLYVNKINI
jgi:hypothetical protein